MKRLLSILLALTLSMTILGACGQKEPAGETPPKENNDQVADDADVDDETETDTSDYKAVCLLNGNLGDKSFFDSANNGMKMIEDELGIETKVIEMGFDNTKWGPALLEVSEQDWDIIIVGTWQMQELLEETAVDFPDKHYILFDSEVDYSTGDFDNVHSITYMQNHGSYLAGIVAGAMAAEGSNIAGAVGGMDIPVINDFLVGYIAGAKDANSDVKILTNYIGDFDDTAKAKEMALSQYNQGAEIVFGAAAQAGLGVIDAAKEKGLPTIGVDADQSATFKGVDDEKEAAIITSVLKNIDVSLLRAVKAHIDGRLALGESETVGLAEGAVGIAKNEIYKSKVPTEVQKKVEDAEADIASGDIVVPSAFDMTSDEIKDLRESVQ